ncbi:diacylglycerol/lipid kinase family protein [Hutsoniella sourekii]|uniref:diacylglycerol/lipid kinase family protein n=1 Tax=Hutsoniella sourekii TaxID=87650 RepID=UPI0004B3B7D7|nr:diacylglycerol kinase family protein [Hutsoniella sourekii]
MFKRVLIIVNPVAGKGHASHYGLKLGQLLMDHYQSEVTIKETQGDRDAFHWARQAELEHYDSVICLGGDGTVQETIEGLMQGERPPCFSFVPLGTVNDLGRALGYSMNPDRAIERFKDMSIDTMDVGLVNDRVFINVVAIGPIPETVMNTDSSDKNRLGVLAYIKDGVSAFFSDKSYHLKVTDSQGQVRQLHTNLLLVGLTNSVGGIELMNPQAKYNDGKMYLIAVKGANPLEAVTSIFQGGILETDPDRMLFLEDKFFLIDEMEASSSSVDTNVDGDPGPCLPLRLEVKPQVLRVYVPNRKRLLVN